MSESAEQEKSWTGLARFTARAVGRTASRVSRTRLYNTAPVREGKKMVLDIAIEFTEVAGDKLRRLERKSA